MEFSFITASKDQEKEAGLRQNLRDVFGTHPSPNAYELIVADGEAMGSEGICALYNWGAERANSDTLIFLHDDIRLLCHPGVLESPYNLVRKPLTGICGVAGTRNLPAGGCWWTSLEEDCRGAVYHPNPNHFSMHLNVWPHMAGNFGQVAICDGALLMCSKPTFKRLKGFDAEAYHGLYHFYDVDISFRAIRAGLNNWVCPIPIFHGSPGVPDESYEVARRIFLAKFKQYLPLRV